MSTQFALKNLVDSDYVISSLILRQNAEKDGGNADETLILVNHGTHLRLLSSSSATPKTNDNNKKAITLSIKLAGLSSSIAGITQLDQNNVFLVEANGSASVFDLSSAISMIANTSRNDGDDEEAASSSGSYCYLRPLSHYETYSEHSACGQEVSNAVLNSLSLSKSQFKNDLYPCVLTSASAATTVEHQQQSKFICIAVSFASSEVEVAGTNGLVFVYVYSVEEKRVTSSCLVQFPARVKSMSLTSVKMMKTAMMCDDVSKEASAQVVHLDMLSSVSSRILFTAKLKISPSLDRIESTETIHHHQNNKNNSNNNLQNTSSSAIIMNNNTSNFSSSSAASSSSVSSPSLIFKSDPITTSYVSDSSQIYSPPSSLQVLLRTQQQKHHQEHQEHDEGTKNRSRQKILYFLNSDRTDVMVYLVDIDDDEDTSSTDNNNSNSKTSPSKSKATTQVLTRIYSHSQAINPIFGPIAAFRFDHDCKSSSNDDEKNQNVVVAHALRTSGSVTTVTLDFSLAMYSSSASAARTIGEILTSKTSESFAGSEEFSNCISHLESETSNSSCVSSTRRNNSVSFQMLPISMMNPVLPQPEIEEKAQKRPTKVSSTLATPFFTCLVNTDSTIDLFLFSKTSMFRPTAPSTTQTASPNKPKVVSSSASSSSSSLSSLTTSSSSNMVIGKPKITISKKLSVPFFGRPTSSTFSAETGEILMMNKNGILRRVTQGYDISRDFLVGEMTMTTNNDDDEASLFGNNISSSNNNNNNNNSVVKCFPSKTDVDTCFIFASNNSSSFDETGTSSRCWSFFIFNLNKGSMEEQEIDFCKEEPLLPLLLIFQRKEDENEETNTFHLFFQNGALMKLAKNTKTGRFEIMKIVENDENNESSSPTPPLPPLCITSAVIDESDTLIVATCENDQTLYCLDLMDGQRKMYPLSAINDNNNEEENNKLVLINFKPLVITRRRTKTSDQVTVYGTVSSIQEENKLFKMILSSKKCDGGKWKLVSQQRQQNDENEEECMKFTSKILKVFSSSSSSAVGDDSDDDEDDDALLIQTENNIVLAHGKRKLSILLETSPDNHHHHHLHQLDANTFIVSSMIPTQNFILEFDKKKTRVTKHRIGFASSSSSSSSLNNNNNIQVIAASSSWILHQNRDVLHIYKRPQLNELSSSSSSTYAHQSLISSYEKCSFSPGKLLAKQRSSTNTDGDEGYDFLKQNSFTVTSMICSGRTLFASVIVRQQHQQFQNQLPRQKQSSGVLVMDLPSLASSSFKYLSFCSSPKSRRSDEEDNDSSDQEDRAFFFCSCSCTVETVVGDEASKKQMIVDDNDESQSQLMRYVVFGTTDGELVICSMFASSGSDDREVKIVARYFLSDYYFSQNNNDTKNSNTSSSSSSSVAAITAISPSQVDGSIVYVALSDHSVCAVKLTKQHPHILAHSHHLQHQQLKDIVSLDTTRLYFSGAADAVLCGSLSSGVVCLMFAPPSKSSILSSVNNSEGQKKRNNIPLFHILSSDPTPNHLLRAVFAGRNCKHAEGDSINFVTFDAFRNISWGRTPERKKKKEAKDTHKEAMIMNCSRDDDDDVDEEEQQQRKKESKNNNGGSSPTHHHQSSTDYHHHHHQMSSPNRTSSTHHYNDDDDDQQQQQQNGNHQTFQSSSPTTRLADHQNQPSHLETASTIWGGGCKTSFFLSNVVLHHQSSSCCFNASTFAPTSTSTTQEVNLIWKTVVASHDTTNKKKNYIVNDFAACQKRDPFLFQQQQQAGEFSLEDQNDNSNKFIISSTGAVSLLNASIPRIEFDVLSVIQTMILLRGSSHRKNPLSLSSTNFLSPYRRTVNTSFVMNDVIDCWNRVMTDEMKREILEELNADFPALVKELLRNDTADDEGKKLEEMIEMLLRRN